MQLFVAVLATTDTKLNLPAIAEIMGPGKSPSTFSLLHNRRPCCFEFEITNSHFSCWWGVGEVCVLETWARARPWVKNCGLM